jgi:outer membrane protein TolC
MGWHSTGHADGREVALERWWSALDSRELDELLDLAAQNNLDLAIARARVRQARAELATAGSCRGPSADANVSYSPTRRSQDSTNGAPFFGTRENDLFD